MNLRRDIHVRGRIPVFFIGSTPPSIICSVRYTADSHAFKTEKANEFLRSLDREKFGQGGMDFNPFAYVPCF